MTIYGRNPVLEYLRDKKLSGAKLFVLESSEGKIIDEIKKAAEKAGVRIFYKKRGELDKTSEGNHQGVILTLSDRNATLTPKELIRKTSESKGVIVALDQLTDIHNIGSIIRTAEALGAEGVVMTDVHSPKMNETIVKTSAGATAHIQVVYITNLASFIEECKENDIWVVGASEKAQQTLNEFKPAKPALLIIGSEGKGMRELTEKKCDFLVRIPMKGKISSLNASVSAGIMLNKIING